MNHRTRILTNLAFLQGNWFVCIWAGANGLTWPALLAVGIGLAVHLGIVDNRRRELLFAGAALAWGSIAESLLAAAGIMSFPAFTGERLLAPCFMLALWVNFSTAFGISLRWLRGRYALAALLGFLGAPPTYFAGARFGAVELADSWYTGLLPIGIAYAIATPLLCLLHHQFDSMTTREEAPA